MAAPYDEEEEIDPTDIQGPPRPTGQIVQQAQLQAEPDYAPAPETGQVDAFARGTTPPSMPQEDAAAANAPTPPTPAPSEVQQIAETPDSYTPQQVEAPQIWRHRYSDPEEDARQQQQDYIQGEQQRRQLQSVEDKRVAKTIKGLKDSGVEIETDPTTGQQRPKTDDQGRVLYHPAVISPLEDRDDGSFVTVHRNRFGDQVEVPVKPRIDPVTGEKFVIDEDGVSRRSLGIDEQFLARRDAHGAGQELAYAYKQRAANAQQQQALKAQLTALAGQAADAGDDPAKLDAIQKDRDRIAVQMKALQAARPDLEQAVTAADAKYLQKKSVVMSANAAKLAQENPGAALSLAEGKEPVSVAMPDTGQPPGLNEFTQSQQFKAMTGDQRVAALKDLVDKQAKWQKANVPGFDEAAFRAHFQDRSGFWGTISELGHGLWNALVDAFPASIAQIAAARSGDMKVRGGDAWYDRWIAENEADERAKSVSYQNLAGDNLARALNTSPSSLFTGLAASVGGAAAGGAAGSVIPGVGTAIGGAIGAAATSGSAFYYLSKYQFLDSYRKMMVAQHPDITQAQWEEIMKGLESQAQEEGAYAAGPAALSGIFMNGVWGITRKLFGATVEKGAIEAVAQQSIGNTLKKFGLSMAEQQGANTITQHGQGNVEARVGLRDKAPTWSEAFEEQALPTAVGAVIHGAGMTAWEHVHQARQNAKIAAFDTKNNEAFAEQYNEQNKDAPDFKPITAEDAPTVRATTKAGYSPEDRTRLGEIDDELATAHAKHESAKETGDEQAIDETGRALQDAAKERGEADNRVAARDAEIDEAQQQIRGEADPKTRKILTGALNAETGEPLRGAEQQALMGARVKGGKNSGKPYAGVVKVGDKRVIKLTEEGRQAIRDSHPKVAKLFKAKRVTTEAKVKASEGAPAPKTEPAPTNPAPGLPTDEDFSKVYKAHYAKVEQARNNLKIAQELGDRKAITAAEAALTAAQIDANEKLGSTASPKASTRDKIAAGTHEWVPGEGLRKKGESKGEAKPAGGNVDPVTGVPYGTVKDTPQGRMVMTKGKGWQFDLDTQNQAGKSNEPSTNSTNDRSIQAERQNEDQTAPETQKEEAPSRPAATAAEGQGAAGGDSASDAGESGAGTGRGRPADDVLTPEAAAILRGIDEGKSAPAFISKNLERIARANGIEVTPEMKPQDVIDALRAKQASVNEEAGPGKTATTEAAPAPAEVPPLDVEAAIKVVREEGKASTSLLQRRMRLGYTRAVAMMHELTRRGVISGWDENKGSALTKVEPVPTASEDSSKSTPPAAKSEAPESKAATGESNGPRGENASDVGESAPGEKKQPPAGKQSKVEAGSLITRMLVGEGLQSSLSKMGWKVTKGSTDRGMQALLSHNGDLTLNIDESALSRRMAREGGDNPEALVRKMVDEEITHLASLEAVKRDWITRKKRGLDGKPESFSAAWEREGGKVANELETQKLADGRTYADFVRDTYDPDHAAPKLEGPNLAAEFVRQLSQMERSQMPTEGFLRKFVERIVGVLRDILGVKSKWSEGLRKLYDRTQEVFNEATGPPKEEEIQQGKVGMKLESKQVVRTSSERNTTPFPDIRTDTERKATATFKRVNEWLLNNAIAEAEARGDEYNARIFRNEKFDNLPQASKDSAEEYLFGQQPAVPPKALKPLVQKPAGNETADKPAVPEAKPETSQPPKQKSKADDKLKQQGRDALEGLFAPPETPRALSAPPEDFKQEPFPKDRRQKLFDLADSMQEQGVTTPEEVAKYLDDISDGKARKFSQALWDTLSAAGHVETQKQDWKAIYAGIDTPAEAVKGEKINKEWTAFALEAGGLGIPRAEMPQVKSEHRGALANFLDARGIKWERTEIKPSDLKPTQQEFSPAKVEKARGWQGEQRAILTSEDGHVIDGHHQWVAKLHDAPDTPIPVIRLKGTVKDILREMAEFPSGGMEGEVPAAIQEPPHVGEETPAPVPPHESDLIGNSSEELQKIEDDARGFDRQVEQEIFGADANKYRFLLRKENASDPKVSDAAFAERQAMEDKLTEPQKRRLFNEAPPYDAEFVRDLKSSVNFVENADTPKELGDALKFAASNFDPDVPPEKSSPKQVKARAEMAAAQKLIRERGWNPDEVAREMITSAAARFHDSDDAALMLGKLARYLKPGTEALPSRGEAPALPPKTEGGALSAPPENAPAENPEPPKPPEESEAIKKLKAAMDALPEIERKVFKAKSNGKSNAEIAAATGLSETGVENAFQIAKRKLRAKTGIGGRYGGGEPVPKPLMAPPPKAGPDLWASATDPAKIKPASTGKVGSLVNGAMSTIKRAIHGLTHPKEWTPFRAGVNEWSAQHQQITQEAKDAFHDLNTKVKDPLAREGITNWIQAGGDIDLLNERAAASKDPKLAEGYRAATRLTGDQLKTAEAVRRTYDTLLKRANFYGIDIGELENYVTQIWKKDPIKQLFRSKSLKATTQFSKKRFYNSYFDGEQAGLTPATKDIAKLLPIYLNDVQRAIADKQLVQRLSEGKASDERPLVAPRGSLAELDKEDDGKAYMVLPESQGEDIVDYRNLEQPALHAWKWQGKDEAGNPIFVKSDLVVHPEIAQHLENILGKRRLSFKDDPTGGVLDTVNTIQSYAKQTMLGFFSPFHAVTEAIHAVGHKINPFFNVEKVDLKNPDHLDAAQHGLMLGADRVSGKQFEEGLTGGNHNLIANAIGKVPGLKWIKTANDAMQNWLFERYIPSLKLKTYRAALERNRTRYAGDMQVGRVSIDQVKHLTAEQVNAAYGHLNYADMGRNPTLQKFLRMTLLAPDFLEARGRFAAQAATGLMGKSGREQLFALGIVGGALILSARVINQVADGDQHWDDPFGVHIGNRRYTVRSVPGDIGEMFLNTRKFVSGRLSPLIGKGTLEALSGVNYRGEPVSGGEVLKDLATGAVPLTLQPFTRWMSETTKNQPVTPGEQLAGAMGVHIGRLSPISDTYKLASAWEEKQQQEKDGVVKKKGVYPTSQYQQLRYALEDDDLVRAKEEIKNLKMDPVGLRKHFKASIFHPFTGSNASDTQFAKSLTGKDKKTFDAAMAQRHNIWAKFQRVAPY